MSVEYYIQVLAALSFIGALLYVVYMISLKYKKNLFSGEIVVKDRLSLNKNVSLTIVEYKSSRYFFGVTDRSIHLLKEFPLSSG